METTTNQMHKATNEISEKAKGRIYEAGNLNTFFIDVINATYEQRESKYFHLFFITEKEEQYRKRFLKDENRIIIKDYADINSIQREIEDAKNTEWREALPRLKLQINPIISIPDPDKEELKNCLINFLKNDGWYCENWSNVDDNKASGWAAQSIDDLRWENNKAEIKTGFERLDAALGGGIYAGRLYGIGAISSLGKTTFAMQIADNIAATGKPVLIFSLEMSKRELYFKSISRQTFKQDGYKYDEYDKETPYKNSKAIEAYKIAKWYSPKMTHTKEEAITLDNAIKAYYKETAPNLHIIEGEGDFGVKQIEATIKKVMFSKLSEPVIIVDYLQILAPYNDRLTDKQSIDKNITELKRITRDYDVPIILINSFNRANYQSEASFESFKESGAIEYGCDVLMAMQLNIEGRDNWNAKTPQNEIRQEINEAKMNKPRKIELVILKNRAFEAYKKLNFDYHTLFDCFIEQP